MKYIIIVVLLVAIGGGIYWYGARSGWFFDGTPSNPPTAAEVDRMEEIEQSSAQIAPDAVAGAGVRPKGSIPPAPTPAPEEPVAAEEEPGEESADPDATPLDLP